MSDFTFQITADATKATRSVEQLEQDLAELEARAKLAERAVQRALAADQPTVAKANAVALKDSADQLQRQISLLTSIRGPMQTFMADQRALKGLLVDGTISAKEYNAALAQLHQQAGIQIPQGARGQGATSGASSLLGGFKSDLGAVGGAVGPVAALAGVGFGASQLIEMSDAYTNLTNRIASVAGPGAQARDALAKINAIATETRSDLGSTGEAFVRITNATKQMGLSQDQVLQLTSRLNKAIILSGAGAAESAAGMLQLSQGLASGRLQGDELRSVLENLPTVADYIAKGLGVTRGQLRQMGADGQITAEKIVEAFNKAGGEIDRNFGKTVPTISQQFAVFKNQVTLAVGELSTGAGAASGMAEVMKTLSDATAASVDQAKFWLQAVGAMNDVGIGLGDVLSGGAKGFIDLWHGIEKTGVNFGQAQAAAGEYTSQQEVLNRFVAAGTGKLNEYAQAQAETAIATILGQQAADKFAAATSTVSNKSIEAKAAAEAYRDTLGLLGSEVAQLSQGLGRLSTALAENAEFKALGIIQQRAKDVHEAKLQLEALKIAFNDGKYPTALYRQEYERLMVIINGTTTAHKKLFDIMKYIREEAKQYDLAFQAAKKAREEFADPHGLELQAQREKEVLELLRSIEGPFDKYEQKIDRLNTLFAEGSISAAQYAQLIAKAMNDSGVGDILTKAEDARREKMTEKFKATLDEYQQEAQVRAELIGQAWEPIGTALEDMFATGKLNLDEFEKSFEKALSKIAMQIVMTSLLMGAFGLSGPEVGALGGNQALGKMLGFATGGRFLVGGGGGTDSQVVAFRATPGEEVTVKTPEQQRKGGSNSGGTSSGNGGTSVVNNFLDPRQLLPVFRTAEGTQEVVNIIRSNAGLIRSLVNRSS